MNYKIETKQVKIYIYSKTACKNHELNYKIEINP
jgi:hypothetical protein